MKINPDHGAGGRGLPRRPDERGPLADRVPTDEPRRTPPPPTTDRAEPVSIWGRCGLVPRPGGVEHPGTQGR